MANRYWVLGGNGDWQSTTNWSATSGGASGASVPGVADNAVFDRSATYTVTAATGTIQVIDFTVSAGLVTFSITNSMTFTGNFTLGVGNVASFTLSAGTFTFVAATGTTKTITTNGVSLTCGGSVTFGSGTTFQGTILLGGNLTFPTAGINLNYGSIDLGNFNLTASAVTCGSAVGHAISFGTGAIYVTNSNLGGIPWDSGTAALNTTGSQQVYITYAGAAAVSIRGGTATTTEANALNFSLTAGSYQFNAGILAASRIRSLNFNAGTFSGTWMNGFTLSLYGSLTLSSQAGFSVQAGTNVQTLASSIAGNTITSNGKALDVPLTFNGVGGSWTLQDDLTQGSTKTLTHTNGTIDLNGKVLNAGASYTTAAGTKSLTFNAGTLLCPAGTTTAFNNAVPLGFSTTAGTGVGKISMTAATAKTFVGGGSTYNCTLSNDGVGALTITGANTFTGIANTVTPTAFTFTAGTTTTVTNWSVNGTAGNPVTIGSVTAATHTISKASGNAVSNYLSVSRSTVTGGATWYAGAASTNGGNNVGWSFTSPAVAYLLTAAVSAYTYTGLGAATRAARAVVSSVGAFSYTGVVAAARATRRLPSSVRAFTAVGMAAALKRTRAIAAGAGAYNYTGVATALTAVIAVPTFYDGAFYAQAFPVQLPDKLRAGVSSYALTGVGAQFRVGKGLSASSAAFTYSGTPTKIQLVRVVKASPGSYLEAAANAALQAKRNLTLSPSAYLVLSSSAGVTVSRRIGGGNTGYGYDGHAVSFLRGVSIRPGAGSYGLTGASAGLVHGYPLAARVAAYGLTVSPARLLYSSFFYEDFERIKVSWELNTFSVYSDETPNNFIEAEDQLLEVEVEDRVLYVDPRAR